MIIENIRKALEVLTDKNVSIGRKSMIFFCVVILVVMVEAIFKVTYNIHINNKLEQLHQISFIRSRSVDNPELAKFLDIKESEVLGRRHYSETLRDSYSWLSDRINQMAHTTSPESPKEDKTRAKLSIFYTVLSGSTFLVFLLVVMILSPLWLKKLDTDTLLGVIISAFLVIPIIAFVTALLMLTPVIYKPAVNYVLFFVLQMICLFIIGNYSKKKEKT